MNRGLLIAPLLLALAACGGRSEDTESTSGPEGAATSASVAPQPSDPPPEAALEQAYRTYVKAFMTGDGATAYALLSERCRDRNELSSFAAASEAAAELYGEVDYVIERITVLGHSGTVDATSAVEALNSGGGSEWVFEDGGWHSDKCS